MSKTTEIYQRLWLKAFQDGELRLDCKTKQSANKTRFALYASVKKVKASPNASALKEAAENCQLSFENEHTIVIRSVLNDPLLQSFAEIAGENLSTMQPHSFGELTPEQEEEKKIQASSDLLLAKMRGEVPIKTDFSPFGEFEPVNKKKKPRMQTKYDSPGQEGLPYAEYIIAFAKWENGEDWE